jgi:hypothetical protein
VGLFLTGKATPNLTLDPPQLVDLYGSFVSPAGVVVSSFTAGGGVAVAIVDASGNPTTPPVGAVYRFNSCAVGTNQCSAAAQVTGNLQQNTPVLTVSSPNGASDALSGGDAGGADGSDGGKATGGKAAARNNANRNNGPPLLAAAPPDPDAVLAEPVLTGAGSEEIWRQHVQAPDKKPEAKP